jgi:hypothetical protein
MPWGGSTTADVAAFILTERFVQSLISGFPEAQEAPLMRRNLEKV